MLTIDEAIKHCEEVAELNEWFDKNCLESMQCRECAKEHRQLAEWLKELKQLREQQPCEDKGEISDGYHTFNQLYHQRAILFATIVNQNKDKAWKSFKHSDGQYCFGSNGEWFIVGVDTPQGSYTYHYSKEYWDYFDCKELDCGKEWDGHTEEDVTRLLSLEQQPCDDAISRQAVLSMQYRIDDSATLSSRNVVNVDDIEDLPSVTPQLKIGRWIRKTVAGCFVYGCDNCGWQQLHATDFCPDCKTKMVEPQKSEDKEYKAESEEVEE